MAVTALAGLDLLATAVVLVDRGLRVHYAKRGRLRFSSHRDFQRALERALRRAEVPMAYSAGFSPHPKISYANSAPTGVASEAEYVEIGVTAECDPDRMRAEIRRISPSDLPGYESFMREADYCYRLGFQALGAKARYAGREAFVSLKR